MEAKKLVLTKVRKFLYFIILLVSMFGSLMFISGDVIMGIMSFMVSGMLLYAVLLFFVEEGDCL